MKYLLIIDSLCAQGGTQTFCRNLSHELQLNGDSVAILTIIDKKRFNDQENVINLELLNNIQILFNLKKIKNIAKNFDRSIVLSGHIFQYIHFALDQKCTIYRESNDPIWRNSNLSFMKRLIIEYLYTIFLQYDYKLFVQNPVALGKIKEKIRNLQNIKYLPNPCFADHVEEVKLFTDREYTIICASRNTWAKGIDRHRYVVSNIICNTVIIGEHGPNDFSDQDHISYFGRVHDVSSYLQKSKFLLLLSRVEGFPNIVHEAIQQGCHIIISEELNWLYFAFSDLRKFISVVNCDSENKLKTSIENIMSLEWVEPETECRKIIRERYSPQNYLKSLLE